MIHIFIRNLRRTLNILNLYLYINEDTQVNILTKIYWFKLKKTILGMHI